MLLMTCSPRVALALKDVAEDLFLSLSLSIREVLNRIPNPRSRRFPPSHSYYITSNEEDEEDDDAEDSE